MDTLLFPLSTFVSGWALSRLARRLMPNRSPQTAPGLVDLVPTFACIHENPPPAVFLNKDGSFSWCASLVGPDLASSPDEQLQALSYHFAKAFTPYADDYTFHLDLIRRPAPSYPQEGDFPDPLTRFLDFERQAAYLAAGALYETETILTVTYRPGPDVLDTALLRFQQGNERTANRDWRAVLSKVQDEAATLLNRLQSVLRITPLGADRALSHFHTCLTGKHHQVRLDGAGLFLDRILASSALVGGWEPHLDDETLTLVTFAHLPSTIAPAQLHALTGLPFPFRLSIRFTPLTTTSAQRTIDRYTQNWFAGKKSLQDLMMTGAQDQPDDPFVNRHAVNMLSDAADATATNQQGDLRFAYVTTTFLVPGASRAQSRERAAELRKLLEDCGFPARLETLNAMAAYHGSLPGQCHANTRHPLMSLGPTAAFAPLTNLWPGHKRHPCPFYHPDSPPILVGRDEGSTPFRLYLHSGDLGHSLVVGPPGAGKSTLLLALACGFLRYPRSRVYFFDRDHSAKVFATASGAEYYDLAGSGSTLSFQPLRDIDAPADFGRTLAWLEALVALQLGTENLSPRQRDSLSVALRDLTKLEPHLRTFPSLAGQITNPEIAFSLTPFVNGPHAGLLGAREDRLTGGRSQFFEMHALMDLDPKDHLPVLLHILARIEKDLTGDPTLIVLDEAGLALLHPVFAGRIKDWALTLRKKNAVLVLAVQALTQLDATSGGFPILLQSCPTRIFLPNESAESPAVRQVYEACGLNARQIARIASSRPKSDYYFTNPDGARLFGLSLLPSELAFFGTLRGRSLQETHRAMDQLIASHGDRWQPAWLNLHGLANEANRLTALMETRTCNGPV